MARDLSSVRLTFSTLALVRSSKRFLAQRRQNVHVRRGFRVHVAGVAAAETAEVARAHLRAVGVGIGVGGIGRRQVIGVIPHFQRRFFKQLRRPGVFLRRQREVVRAVRGEGVAAAAFADDLAFDRPGGPGSTEYFFRFIEERFQLVVGDAETRMIISLGMKFLP